MSYYNLCGIDHNTVIFQMEKGRIHIKITGMQDSNQGRQK